MAGICLTSLLQFAVPQTSHNTTSTEYISSGGGREREREREEGKKETEVLKRKSESKSKSEREVHKYLSTFQWAALTVLHVP